MAQNLLGNELPVQKTTWDFQNKLLAASQEVLLGFQITFTGRESRSLSTQILSPQFLSSF